MARIEYEGTTGPAHETRLTFLLGRDYARRYLMGRAYARHMRPMPAGYSAAFEAGYDDWKRHEDGFGTHLFREHMIRAGLGHVLKTAPFKKD